MSELRSVCSIKKTSVLSKFLGSIEIAGRLTICSIEVRISCLISRPSNSWSNVFFVILYEFKPISLEYFAVASILLEWTFYFSLITEEERKLSKRNKMPGFLSSRNIITKKLVEWSFFVENLIKIHFCFSFNSADFSSVCNGKIFGFVCVGKSYKINLFQMKIVSFFFFVFWNVAVFVAARL